jgi:hypothetical protein
MISLPAGGFLNQFQQLSIYLKSIYKGDEVLSYGLLIQSFWVILCTLGYVKVATWDHSLWEVLVSLVRYTSSFVIVHTLYYYIDVHKRWGPWGVSEPKSHFKFTMQTLWIPVIFTLGDMARRSWYRMDRRYSKLLGRIGFFVFINFE